MLWFVFLFVGLGCGLIVVRLFVDGFGCYDCWFVYLVCWCCFAVVVT